MPLYRRACWKASSSVTSRAPSRAQIAIESAVLNRPTAGRSSSTRSATSIWKCRPSSCAFSRKCHSSGVGSSQPIKVNVRILAATHQDLEALMRAGRFREDLYYRLNVICLQAPALRERREDIFELAVYFLNVQSQRTGKLVTHLEPEAVEALAAYEWPGNIRELENVLERAVVLADGPAVTVGDLPPEVRQPIRRRVRPRLPKTAAGPALSHSAKSGLVPALPAPSSSSSLAHSSIELLSASEVDRQTSPEEWNAEFLAYERQRLMDVLDEAKGNKSVAARLLGIPRSTLFSKLKKHGIV